MALGQIVSEDGEERQEEEVDDALAMFGLYAIRAAEVIEPLYLWPENVPSWNLFQALSTQWLCGFGGRTGLNYPGVEVVMRIWRIKRKDERRVFQEIQAMELAVLNALENKK